MDVSINARNCKVPESVRNQAVQRFSRMERLDRGITAATLVFDGAPNAHRAEARLAVSGGPPLVGHGVGASLRTAMDGAMSRLQSQLKRRRERITDRRNRKVAVAPMPLTEGDEPAL